MHDDSKMCENMNLKLDKEVSYRSTITLLAISAHFIKTEVYQRNENMLHEQLILV